MKSKLPVPTAKQINEAHRLARSSAETAVQHAIRCGQMLMQIGANQEWVDRHTEIAWSTAKRYISAAKKNAQGIAFESLRHCFPSGQKTRAAAEKRGQSATAVAKNRSPAAEIHTFSDSDTSAQGVKGAVMNPPESAAQGSEAGNRNKPVGVEAGPVRPPVPAPESDEPQRPEDIDEDAALAAADQEMHASFEKAFGSDAATEIKRLTAELAVVKLSRDGFMNGKASVTKLLKAEQRKTERQARRIAELEKENTKLLEQIEALRERISIMEAA